MDATLRACPRWSENACFAVKWASCPSTTGTPKTYRRSQLWSATRWFLVAAFPRSCVARPGDAARSLVVGELPHLQGIGKAGGLLDGGGAENARMRGYGGRMSRTNRTGKSGRWGDKRAPGQAPLLSSLYSLPRASPRHSRVSRAWKATSTLSASASRSRSGQRSVSPSLAIAWSAS